MAVSEMRFVASDDWSCGGTSGGDLPVGWERAGYHRVAPAWQKWNNEVYRRGKRLRYGELHGKLYPQDRTPGFIDRWRCSALDKEALVHGYLVPYAPKQWWTRAQFETWYATKAERKRTLRSSEDFSRWTQEKRWILRQPPGGRWDGAASN